MRVLITSGPRIPPLLHPPVTFPFQEINQRAERRDDLTLVSQVNGNGVLSFARAMHRFFNIAFPLDDPVIAPLYTHVDTRGSGRVYYGETDAPEILARAGGMVRSAFTDAADFVPTHAFLATWVDVGYYNGKSDKVSRGEDLLLFPRIRR